MRTTSTEAMDLYIIIIIARCTYAMYLLALLLYIYILKIDKHLIFFTYYLPVHSFLLHEVHERERIWNRRLIDIQ